jgi:DNA (cytosine-5)-methyltransferase 1
MSPLFPQMLLDLNEELIVDLFAGGGGASVGIEMALGRSVDVAVDHDAAAVALHQANHPQTKHHTCDVFEVDPREVTQGRPIGLLWASPDCTYHSKARGAKPIRHKNRKRRALAWVVTRWAGQVRPRVIMLENVEEFADWGPLVGPPDALRPCPRRRGRTFRTWRRSLERLGYQVERRELRASDYGAPTIRKRLFVIARCDGQPIVWPEKTHGPGRKHPFRTAAECIDWNIPMCSIFATREEARDWGKRHGQAPPVRPLAEATMRRVARGVMRYVVNNPKPYIVGVGGRQGQSPELGLDVPLQTITAKRDSALVAPVLTEHANASGQRVFPGGEPLRTQVATVKGGHFSLVAPYLVPRYGDRDGQEPRTRSIDEPAPVVVPSGNGASLVGAFLAKHFTGVDGAPLNQPAPTVTTIDHNALVAAHIQRDFGTSVGHAADGPIGTITSDYGGHAGLVASFLAKYYGTGDGDEMSNPAPTITTKDHFGLVTVTVKGEPYVIADIAMRMLQPRELYTAQGFPLSYIIDRGADGGKLTKTEQVRMVGNSVCPPIASALARANVPEMVVRELKRGAA